MEHRNGLRGLIQRTIGAAFLLLLISVCAWAQESSSTVASSPDASMTAAIHELQQQVRELREAVADIRSETAEYRAENAELKRELQAMRPQLADTGAMPQRSAEEGLPSTNTEAAVPQPHSLQQRVASLEETAQLLNSKVNDQYQTKVESASKYRVRLSGLVLLNLFSNRGATDNQDFPSFVPGQNPQTSNFGATVRQSEIGLEVFGPTLAGAKTSGSVQADFAGGFPNTWNGVTSGIFRLRTASMRMDWEHTSLITGQDDFFLSPLSPTSFASIAVPAFNYAGNLWTWTPQLRVEHRFDLSDDQRIMVQAGIFDNLSGEFPADSYFRVPQAGELSRQPAYGLRTTWTKQVFGQPLTVGTAGYYARQVWPFEHYVDGWAGMADWQIPVSARVNFSGEFYRGRGVGGIGGGISRSVVFVGNPANPYTQVIGLDSIGGWSQLKLKATNKLEFNAAVGVDNPMASEVRAGAPSLPYTGGSLLVQNRSALTNFVYRPRSDLLFSAEYRHLQSFQIFNVRESAEQVNLMMGILF